MMTVQFRLTASNDLTPRALAWLQVSLDKTPNNETALQEILSRDGEFYLVVNEISSVTDEIPIGCIYLEWLPEILNIVLLGGDNIKPWRDDLHNFLVNLIRERGITTIMFCGRYGIGKLFPQFKAIGTLYTYKDKGGG